MADWSQVIDTYKALSQTPRFRRSAPKMLDLIRVLRSRPEFEHITPSISLGSLHLCVSGNTQFEVGVEWMPFDTYNIYIEDFHDKSINRLLLVNEHDVIPKLVEYISKAQSGKL